MLEKLENRQKEIQGSYQEMANQVKALTENLEQARANLNKIVGQFEENNRLITEQKLEDEKIKDKEELPHRISMEQVPSCSAGVF